MKGLLAVERMVLESLSKGKNTILEISKDTRLTEFFVRTILSNLKDYGVISYSKGKFEVRISKQLSDFNKSNNVKFEVKDLFGSLVENYFDESNTNEKILKMQKIWLTDLEYKILKSMLDNVGKYIIDIRKDRLLNPEQETLAEQRVIFWGADSYSNLIKKTFKAA